MAKRTVLFVCQSCGAESPRWMGKCPVCNEWNTLVEETTVVSKKAGPRSWVERSKPMPLTEIKSVAEPRFSSGIDELDRVLGGGLVPGCLGLIGVTGHWKIHSAFTGCKFRGKRTRTCIVCHW